MPYLIEIEIDELFQVNEVVSLLLDQQVKTEGQNRVAVRIHEVDDSDMQYLNLKKEVE